MERSKAAAPRVTEYWLQRWIAIAESMGIGKKSMFSDYYFDEFLTVLDEYNAMHSIETAEDLQEVGAEDW